MYPDLVPTAKDLYITQKGSVAVTKHGVTDIH